MAPDGEAIANLLLLAGTTPEEVVEKREDDSRRATLQNAANARLREFFTTAWRQASLTVELAIEPTYLRVFVRDLNGEHSTAKFTDRSDGLRLFVCLAAFLKARAPHTPPVLLIDEAEQHLHLNAQADLVNLLQDSDEISQVVYTTHSPACLPTDLGSGVRFVEPSRTSESSTIRHDFWSESTKDSSGFSPLLFVMGAGAAAFASVRRALVAEGPSEMPPPPTLVRLANDLHELDYQVAPGIAIASQESLRILSESATRVAYVVDGDAGGAIWSERSSPRELSRRTQIYRLSKNAGVEDLLDRDFYVQAMNAAIAASGKSISKADISSGTVKSGLKNWGLRNPGILLGSVGCCRNLFLGRHESGEAIIRLSTRGTAALKSLHSWVEDQMESAPN